MAEQPTVAIVDYGLCNLFSVRQACLHVGLSPVVTQDPETVLAAAGVILPGVGAFGEAMANLDRLGLTQALREAAGRGTPLMGICLGMQLLLSESEEFGLHPGLGLIPGRVVRFTPSQGGAVRVPQIGWNTVHPGPAGLERWARSPLRGVRDGDFMYFVHSYYALPERDEVVLATTEYGGRVYCSAILQDNVFATQFHPEKSAGKGIAIYRAWAQSLSGEAPKGENRLE